MTIATASPQSLLLPAAATFVGRERGAFIDGVALPLEGPSIESIDPSTGNVITRIAESGAALVDRAVRSSHVAFEGEWGRMMPAQRESALHRFADLIEANAAELAQYDSLEGGKPVTHVQNVDLPLAVEQFRYYAGWPTKIQGATVPVSTRDAHVYTRRVPMGVVAAITPWNFPLCQAAIKLAPALAAGNTVVLKPSELTSLSSLRLAELAMEAGLPRGTVNVVTGTGAITGQELVSHPLVRKITFTGSEAVGRHLGAEAGRSLKQISLELGGKNPNVIFADADITKAAAYAATTAYFYSGQVCFSGSRLMVERSVLDEVVAAIQLQADALVLGHGLDPNSTMGPLSSAAHREKVERYLETVEGTRGTVLFGGSRPENDGDGYFLQATAVLDPTDTDPVVVNEIFGPVLVIQPFDSVDELLPRANSGQFGLTAGVWTNDVRKAHLVAQQLQAGTVWVNTYGDYNAAAPFGGFKDSGFGRDCGPEGLDKFLDVQTVWMSLA
jgi:phenylacetaldehyde dehydrogenase